MRTPAETVTRPATRPTSDWEQRPERPRTGRRTVRRLGWLLPAALLALATGWLLVLSTPVQAEAPQAPAHAAAAAQFQNASPSISAATAITSTAFFTTTGSLYTERRYHTATLLPDGRVLVAGGKGSINLSLASAEIYDPASGTWSDTGSLSTGRFAHTATLLPDGRVLVAGGYNGGALSLASAEIYDPASGTWSDTGSLSTDRDRHTATLLPDGTVLVAGGFNGGYLASGEIYDPATGTWSDTNPLNTPRHYHTATLLPDGRVLVAGGYNSTDGDLDSAEIYDRGLGFDDAWRPQLTSITTPAVLGQPLDAAGAGWRGVGFTEASGGGTNSSATNYPLLRLQRIDNEQTLWLPSAHFTATALTSLPLSGTQPGPALATIFVNGIPSQSQIMRVAALTTLTVTKVLSPTDDAGLFNLIVAGVGGSTDVGHNGSYTQTLPTGAYTVTESAGSGTSLADYTSAYACDNGLSGAGTTIPNVFVGATGVSCTFTNTRILRDLTVTTVGAGSGNVTSNPPAIDCGVDCTTSLASGSVVTLTAEADLGSTFAGWGGDASGNANPLAVTMDGSKAITATFTQDEYTLDVSTVGSGSVEKQPNLAAYPSGTAVTLTASADTGWAFAGWSGDASGDTNPLSVTMDASKAITATFTEDGAPVNAPPVFTSVPVTEVTVGASYVYSVTADDPDAGDTLTISAPTKPGWLTLTPTGNGTATLSGAPNNADVGEHAVVLRVEDQLGASAQQPFTVVVFDPNPSVPTDLYLPLISK